MKRHSVVWVLTLVLFVATLLSLLLSGVLLVQTVRTQYLETAERNLRRHTESIAALMGRHMEEVALTPAARARISEEMIRLSTQLGGRMCIVNWEGRVLEDSSPDQPQEVGDFPEVHEALNGRYHSVIRDGSLFLALPMQARGKTVGAVYSSVSLSELENLLEGLTQQLWVTGSWAMLIALVLSLALGFFLTRPLSRLATGVKQIAEGDYDYRLGLSRKDELGQLAREIDVMAGALADHQRILMQFVSDASHELKTPIASLKALSEALSDGAADDPKTRERFLALVRAEVDRMDRLVASLLALQRGESGLDSLSVEPAPLLELVGRAVRSLPTRSDQVLLLIDTDLHVKADGAKLEQVLLNLLSNALRAVSDHENPEVVISASKQGDKLLIEVTDNGPGIAEPELDKVFDRFYRCELDRSRDAGGGSGLGLAICRQIVEAHQGEIWAQNHESGARFSILLPS